MEMEEGGGGGESARDGRGVIQRREKTEGAGGLKGAIQRETLVKNQGGVEKRRNGVRRVSEETSDSDTAALMRRWWQSPRSAPTLVGVSCSRTK